MDQKRIKQISSQIIEKAGRGNKFGKIKSDLLAEGFTNIEITHALYAATLESQNDTKNTNKLLEEIYEINPELAKQMAKTIADDAKTRKEAKFFDDDDLWKYGGS